MAEKKEGPYAAWNQAKKVITNSEGKQYIWFKATAPITASQAAYFEKLVEGAGMDAYVYFKDNDTSQGTQRITFKPISKEDMAARMQEAKKFSQKPESDKNAAAKSRFTVKKSVDDINF